MPPKNEGMRLWGGEVFSFPNFFVLPMYGNALCYREPVVGGTCKHVEAR
jgi:hypothetical protein